MAKVTFLTFYNDYSIGVNVLSSLLATAGHDVSAIFFKLPSKAKIEWFRKKTICLETVDAHGDIIGGNSEVNRWTNREIDLLVDVIKKLGSEILCVSSRSPDTELVLEVLPKIREKFNGIMLAGGFGPTLDPEVYLDLVDYVFIGEAENKIQDLIARIENDENLNSMGNICFRRNGKTVKNRLGTPDISDFKTQVIPEKTVYIENNRVYSFEERGKVMNTHTYSTFIGRGCVNACTYCSAGRWYKVYNKEGIKVKRRRNRPLEDIMEELLQVKNTNCTFVLFRDSFLSASTSYLKEFFRLYEREVNIPFWAYLIPKQIIDHPELLRIAVDAGLVDTEIGFQSGSERINKKVFQRTILLKDSIKYAKMLAEYDVNMKYDFITFNPAETKEDIRLTFKVVQSLPKKRSYLYLPRLLYFPGSPIFDILSSYREKPMDFGYHYSVALLYLLCFVLSEKEFEQILNKEKMVSSWRHLLSFYKDYLKRNGIDFPIGTHDVPNSITTPRYERMLKKRQYSDVIVWGAGDYYKEMATIFEGHNIRYHIDDEKENIRQGNNVVSPEILGEVKESLPIFICSPRKQEIKMKIINDYLNYTGKIFV